MDEPASVRLFEHLIERLSSVEERLARMEEQAARDRQQKMLRPLKGLRGGELYAEAYDGLQGFMIEVLPRKDRSWTSLALFPMERLAVETAFRDAEVDATGCFVTPGARGASNRLAGLSPKMMLVTGAGITFEAGTGVEEALKAYVKVCAELGQSPGDIRLARLPDIGIEFLNLMPEMWGPYNGERFSPAFADASADLLVYGLDAVLPAFEKMDWTNWGHYMFM